MRVVLAYGDDLSRAGIRVLLESLPGVKVVGEAAEGRGAVAVARRRKPDICLLEDSLLGLNGLEAASRIAKEAPVVKTVILSDMADAQSVATALRAGAKGYILKSTPVAHLSKALAEVFEGRVHVSSGVSKKLLAPGGRAQRWAWFPAIGLAIVAVIVALSAEGLGVGAAALWPILVVVAGIAIVVSALRSRR